MKKRAKAQPIGFLQGSPPSSPFSHHPSSSPFIPGQNSLANNPAAGGLFQGLTGGNIMSTIENAQKIINTMNQIGPMFSNLSPMLQLFRGLPIQGIGEMNHKILHAVSVQTTDGKRLSRPKQKRKKATKLRCR